MHAVCYTWNEAEMSSQQTLRKRKTVPNVLPAIAICTRYCGLVRVFAFVKCTACMKKTVQIFSALQLKNHLQMHN